MRPLIDKNNLNFSKDFLIYYTRGKILERILFLIGVLIGFIYFYTQNQIIVVLIFFCFFIFQIPLLIKSIKKIDEIQFKINSKGIQYKEDILIPWNNIENERAVWEHSKNREDDKQYFIYYIIEPSQVMKFDLNELSTDASELSIVLTVQRNRFKKENNII